MCYGLNREGLDILIKYKLFLPDKQFPTNKYELIFSSEVAMSVILRHEKKSLYSYFYGQGLITPDTVQNTGDMWHTNVNEHYRPELVKYYNSGIV